MVQMNWKLVTVMLISLILLIVCYMSLDLDKSKYQLIVKRYLKYPAGEVNQVEYTDLSFGDSRKIKVDSQLIQKEDDLKKLKIPDDHVVYYFPGKCPSYKQDIFLISTEDGLDKYYVPEEYHLVLVQKTNRWSKEPDFTYWKWPY